MNDESDKSKQVDNPFGSGRPQERGAGAMVQADRAQQEIQAAMLIAYKNPRDSMRAMDRILQDCSRPSVAEQGLYAYPKGGETVSGPSIRLAELVAQRWGNLWCGVTELQQDHDKTVAMAWAWDLETNARDERTFTVPHMRYTKRGSYKLEDPREIYELIANYGARRKRAAIQTVVPREVFDAAVEQVERTLAENVSVDPDSIEKMTEAFGDFGVTKQQLVKYIGHRLDTMITAEMVRLKKVYASIRDGFAAPRDFFGEPETSEGGGEEGGSGGAGSTGAERFKKKAASKKKSASKKKAAAASQGRSEEGSDEDGGSQGSGESAPQDATGDDVDEAIGQMENAQSKDELDEIADEALNGTDLDEAGRERLTAAHKRNAERVEMAATQSGGGLDLDGN